ncbi:hypothetical protein BZA77DRAFT_64225 [Pyronema omphalodes]|nr:hypothetical protein BZA77DRAFT_64225 [Pyronema omphalodes]
MKSHHHRQYASSRNKTSTQQQHTHSHTGDTSDFDCNCHFSFPPWDCSCPKILRSTPCHRQQFIHNKGFIVGSCRHKITALCLNEYMTSMGQPQRNQYYEHIGGAREMFGHECECEIRRNGVLPCGCKWTREAEHEFELNWKVFMVEYLALQRRMERERAMMERRWSARKRVRVSPRRGLKRGVEELYKRLPGKSISIQNATRSGRVEKEGKKRSTWYD